MANAQVVFLERPVVGVRCPMMLNGQRVTCSPVVHAGEDSQRPGWFTVQTTSGSTYYGPLQAAYQATTYATQQSSPPPAQPIYATQQFSSPQPPYSNPPVPIPIRQDEKIWAVLCHVSMFFVGIFGPLVLWLILGKDSALVDAHGKEALNLSITMIIAGFVCAVLSFLLIGFLLGAIVCVYFVVAPILAAISAARGEYYEYPYCLRLVK